MIHESPRKNRKSVFSPRKRSPAFQSFARQVGDDRAQASLPLAGQGLRCLKNIFVQVDGRPHSYILRFISPDFIRLVDFDLIEPRP